MSDASIGNSRLIQAERSLKLKVSSSWPAPGCSRDAGERRAAAVRPARLGSPVGRPLGSPLFGLSVGGKPIYLLQRNRKAEVQSQ